MISSLFADMKQAAGRGSASIYTRKYWTQISSIISRWISDIKKLRMKYRKRIIKTLTKEGRTIKRKRFTIIFCLGRFKLPIKRLKYILSMDSTKNPNLMKSN